MVIWYSGCSRKFSWSHLQSATYALHVGTPLSSMLPTQLKRDFCWLRTCVLFTFWNRFISCYATHTTYTACQNGFSSHYPTYEDKPSSRWYHWSVDSILPQATSINAWCNGYHLRKWTQRPKFKPWTKLFAFHFRAITLGKDVNSSLLSLPLDSIGSLALVRQPSLEKENWI